MGTALVIPTKDVKMLIPRTAASLQRALRKPKAVVLRKDKDRRKSQNTSSESSSERSDHRRKTKHRGLHEGIYEEKKKNRKQWHYITSSNSVIQLRNQPVFAG